MLACPRRGCDFDPAKRRFMREPALPPGASAESNGNSKATESTRTISDEQRQALTALLTRKGKTAGSALKTAGSHSADLADLTVRQHGLLVAKLEALPDKEKEV
jgi:hypothetical protein